MGKRGIKPTYVFFTCKQCGKEFARTKAQLNSYKNRTPITCSNECREVYVAAERRKSRNGAEFTCAVCGEIFYRGRVNIEQSNPTCCSRKCLAIHKSGPNNPFWNRTHSDETKAKISKSRKGKCIGNKSATGYKHLAEAKKRISEASKNLWQSHREMMVESRLRGKDNPMSKLPHVRRHRVNFTPLQRREWADNKCKYCGTAEHLELDHIIPVFNGGKNIRENCQTLCRGCNLWKTHNVDLPFYYAALAIQGDPN